MSHLAVAVVHACLRDGHGGSPTAVAGESAALDDEQRRALPGLLGTSHAVFVSGNAPAVSLRFFTSAGELPACGHGTIAALAFAAQRSGGQELRTTVRAKGRVFSGRVSRAGERFDASFDPGTVDVHEPACGEHSAVLDALGVPAGESRVAVLGRPRLLVPVATRSALAALAPDLDQLRAACDRLGLLGCYAYCGATAQGRVAARMFAPSIGVPEDIANANSTACLAAALARGGAVDISVDMGDSLGEPATVTAAARRAGGPVSVGGAARITSTVHVQLPHR